MRLRGINYDSLTKGIEKMYEYNLKYFRNNNLEYKYMTKEENENKAKHKAKIVRHFRKFGLESTLDAFEYKKTQIYHFNKLMKDNNNNWKCLLEKNKEPINKRKKDYIKNKEILEEIKRLRLEDYCNIGKVKLNILINKFILKNNIKENITINKISNTLKYYPDLTFKHRKISHFGKIKEYKKKNKLRINNNKISAPAEVVQIDTIETYLNGVRRYTITAVDRFNKQVFAYSYIKQNSKNAQDFLEKLIYVWNYDIKSVQTDNGKEFLGEFDNYCIENKIKHYFNYARCPKMNGCVERFNRTIQEDFIDYNEYLLFNNIKEYNIKLMEYLIRYNTERPHQSLNYLSPIDYLISKGYFSDMYPSHTFFIKLLYYIVKLKRF